MRVQFFRASSDLASGSACVHFNHMRAPVAIARPEPYTLLKALSWVYSGGVSAPIFFKELYALSPINPKSPTLNPAEQEPSLVFLLRCGSPEMSPRLLMNLKPQGGSTADDINPA